MHSSPCLPVFRLAASAAAAAWLLAGCGAQIGPLTMPGGSSSSSSSSSTPSAPAAADNSPAVPTAVHVVALSSDGLAGFFPFEGTSSTFTRSDMKRDETTLKGTGAVSRFIMSNSAHATITRLDRKLVYALDIPRSEYTECPLTGCAQPTPPQQQQREPQQPGSSREPECKMKVASNTFNVKPTSQRKAINGFDTEQYAVDWTVALEDPNKRRSTLQLTMDLWTTPVTPALRDAMAMEASYVRTAFAATAAERNAAAAAGAVLPQQFMDMMNRYFGQSMTPADRAALFNIGRQMERIKGQPIVTTLRLFFSGNACGGAEEGSAGAGGGAGGGGGGAGGIAGAISGLFGRGSSSSSSGGGSSSGGSGDKPLLSFTQEVKTWKVEPVRDSQFVPPPQFKRKNPG